MAAMAWLPVPAGASRSSSMLLVPSAGRWDDPDVPALARDAVDVAMAAGATYADARLTLTREQRYYGPDPIQEQELHGIGVRVLVNGFWGFVSSAVWTRDEAVRLARGAVAQAKANGVGKTRELELGPPPPPVTTDWVMPVKYDPFDISYGEKRDFANAIMEEGRNYLVGNIAAMSMYFQRQQKVVATSDGSAFQQTTYVTQGMYGLTYRDQYSLRLDPGTASADYLSPAGKGWEYLTESGLLEDIPRLSSEAEQTRHVVPVEVGRYDVVCNARSMAALVDATLGAATELDRALGYEANADGSSYLSEPLEMLGTYQVGSTLLNLSADRSTEGGLATAPCDDEAVAAETFPLVQRGVVVDYQTTREQAVWLAPYYSKIGRPVRSHGCARCEAATSTPMQAAPNLQLLPGKADTTFEDLVAGTEKGLALVNVGSVFMDQQQLNGLVRPIVRQIKNGKLGPYVAGAGMNIRSPELWKNLTAIGGTGTTRWLGLSRGKGQPMQRVSHSVGAVPGKITGMGVVDINRRG